MKVIEAMPRVLRSFVEMLLNGNEAEKKEGNRFITMLTKTKNFFFFQLEVISYLL